MSEAEDKLSAGIWKWVITSIGAFSIIAGAIFWLAKVENTAEQAYKMSVENSVKIEKITLDINDVRETLIEIRADLKYLVQNVKNVK